MKKKKLKGKKMWSYDVSFGFDFLFDKLSMFLLLKCVLDAGKVKWF
jgi:hypothetical protein